MAAEKITFEQALGKLDDIVRRMEESETGLEETLALYKQGVGLAEFCVGELNCAEAEIAALDEKTKKDIEEAISYAEFECSEPPPGTLYDDIYADGEVII
jgi:exodeoxyribonuclease VII small subunit